MQLMHDLFAIAKFLLLFYSYYYYFFKFIIIIIIIIIQTNWSPFFEQSPQYSLVRLL